ncbi:MAG: NTP transferase domain-containing protein [Bacteroidetes bacterium]|nr:NTP transferase domain-containing protein [Bacteroidota bacterium]
MNHNHFAVIMAGGIGSRFWPASTSKTPKQFLDILNCGKSLIQLTYERFTDICPVENIYVVTNESYGSLVAEHLPEIPEENILKEPVGKNTAPCVAFAANIIYAKNKQAVMTIASADHSIGDKEAFQKAVVEAMNEGSNNDWLICLAIEPTRPDTGYGYIQFDDSQHAENIFKVKTFTEKPSAEIAQQFLDSGEFLWNSGIFIWSAKTILNAFDEYLEEVGNLFAPLKTQNAEKRVITIQRAYDHCPNISIDYGILEKATNVYVKPASFNWSDVGTWNALYDISEKTEGNNVSNKKAVFFKNSGGNIVNSTSDKLVVLNDVNDLIVVESHEVILVASRNTEQNIKQLVTELKVQKDYKKHM